MTIEKAMEDAHQKASDNVEKIAEATEEYQMKMNKLEQA